jgi:hypothetical protein
MCHRRMTEIRRGVIHREDGDLEDELDDFMLIVMVGRENISNVKDIEVQFLDIGSLIEIEKDISNCIVIILMKIRYILKRFFAVAFGWVLVFSLLKQILKVVETHDNYFVQKHNVAGVLGFFGLQEVQYI